MYKNKRLYLVNHVQDKQKYTYIIKKLHNTINDSYYQSLNFQNNDDTYFKDILEINNNYFANNILIEEESFDQEFKNLEEQPLEYFQSKDKEDLTLIDNYLYHVIRFQKHLEKLESIFKDRAIIASNYQKNYYDYYDDNCNNGQYISLASIDGTYDLTYNTFIIPNISLVISSQCNAIKTIYLPYEKWQKIDIVMLIMNIK